MASLFLQGTLASSYGTVSASGAEAASNTLLFAKDFPSDVFEIIGSSPDFLNKTLLDNVLKLPVGNVSSQQAMTPFSLSTTTLQMNELLSGVSSTSPYPNLYRVDSSIGDITVPVPSIQVLKEITIAEITKITPQVDSIICTKEGFAYLNTLIRTIFLNLCKVYIRNLSSAVSVKLIENPTSTTAVDRATPLLTKIFNEVDILVPTRVRRAVDELRTVKPLATYLQDIRNIIHSADDAVYDTISKKIFYDVFYPYFVFQYLYKMTVPDVMLSLNTKMLALVACLMFINYMSVHIDSTSETQLSTYLAEFINKLTDKLVNNSDDQKDGILDFYQKAQQLSDENTRAALSMSKTAEEYQKVRAQLLSESHNVANRQKQVASVNRQYWITLAFLILVITAVLGLIALNYLGMYQNRILFNAVNALVLIVVCIYALVSILKNI